MEPLPYFKLYAAEFLTDEKVLQRSLEDVGILLKAWCFCWREGSIPAEPGRLAAIVGTTPERILSADWLADFFLPMSDNPNRLHSERMTEERNRVLEIVNKRKAASDGRWALTKKKAGKGSKKDECKCNANAMQMESNCNALAMQTISKSRYKDLEERGSGGKQVKMVFPCRGEIKSWELTEEHFGRLGQVFPGLDLAGEMARAKLWLEDSPTRQKTARGMPKFLSSWLGRAADRQGGRAVAVPPVPKTWTPEQVAAQDKAFEDLAMGEKP